MTNSEILFNLANTIEILTKAQTNIYACQTSQNNNESDIDKLLSDTIKLTSDYVNNIPSYDTAFQKTIE